MASSRVVYKIAVYDITAASGYKSGSGAVADGAADGYTITDDDCAVYFAGSKYPSTLPATDGTDALTAEDLSAVFNRKTFADVDAAKTAIISSDLATAISTNCSTVSYSLDSNNLVIDCIHADDDKNAAMKLAMDADGWSSEAGAVYSTA
jgi:hypothetical protein